MNKVFLVGHTGSINRGCEALVRSTVKLLNEVGIHDIYIVSEERNYDARLGVDKICSYLNLKNLKKYSFSRVFFGVCKKVFGISEPIEKIRLKYALDIMEKDDIVLIIGGDTYCYNKPVKLFAYNRIFKRIGAKTILWGCSIEDSLIDNDMLKDFSRYDYIFPREQLSYSTLLNHGVDKDKLFLMSDSAFNLDAKPVKEFENTKNTVGINVSPIVVKNSKIYSAVKMVIDYILNNTDMDILLIPHVYDEDIHDDKILKKIKEDFADNNRVVQVCGMYTCEELKYIISKCRFFVGARTHASIAAYSMGVPTLVMGYSVKSRGIALDLFGTEDNYVLIAEKLNNNEELLKAFLYIYEHEYEIREQLKKIMPEIKAKSYKAVNKVKKLFENSDCMGCGACKTICNNNCVQMSSDKKGFLYPHTELNNCTQCNLCRNVCPLINHPEKHGIRKSYAALSKDDSLRMSSSSGGLFGVFAKKVLSDNGIVFGAGFDSQFNVCHYSITDEKNLDKLLRSKYVQSNIGDCYKEAREYLDAGKSVLFCGTPCQIGGLHAYLGHNYDNLIAIDFICHGVPSPKAWRKYLEERMREADTQKIRNINFRSKESGWQGYSMRIEFDNKKVYSKQGNQDPFLKSFLQNISIRESCSQCKFKGKNGVSDITLGDFWGINQIESTKSFSDNKGVSVVVIHTEIGESLFENITSEIKSIELREDEAFKANTFADKAIEKNALSEKFFRDLDSMSFDAVVDKYCGAGIIAKVRRKLKK